MTFRFPSSISAFSFLPVGVFFGVVASSPRAHADETAPAPTVALTTMPGVTHTLPNGDSFTRAASLHPEGVNFEDCMLDVQINIPLTVTNASAGANPLTVFAGTNCDTYANRQIGAAGATCWPVAAAAFAYTEGASYPVAIRVRQIIAQLYSSPKTAYSAVQNSAVCYSQPDSAVRDVSLYFLLTTTDVSETVALAITSFGVDLAAAAPPSSVSVGIGDTLLAPKWNAIVDPDIVGFDVYSYKTSLVVPVKNSTVCDEAGAGDAESAAADAGDAGGTHCHTVEIFDPTPVSDSAALPYDPDGFACASPFPVDTSSDGGVIAGATETVAGATTITSTGDGGTSAGDAAAVTSSAASIGPLDVQPNETGDTFLLTAVAGNVTTTTIDKLTDFSAYAVAVAATDGYGNVGAFSSSGGEAVCQYPLPVTDFFTTYIDEGGEAGGSFCTFSTSDSSSGPFSSTSSAIVTLVALIASVTSGASRRRRRGRGRRP